MPAAPAARLAARVDALRRRLADAGLDALIVTHLPNVAYLTNFEGSAGIAVVTLDAVLLLADARYRPAVEALAAAGAGLEPVPVPASFEEALAGVLVRPAAGRTGFEADHMPVARHTWLGAALAAAGLGDRLVPTSGLVERGRLIKDQYELAILREAARRLGAVAVGVIAEMRAGDVETEVALRVEMGLRRAGFARPAFDTIVASGPRAALPHGRAADRRLAPGDLVVLDFGGVYGGYCVDLTRTVSVGEPDRRARDVHAAVLEAQAAALAALRPGVATSEVDAEARRVLAARGLGEAFTHATGHGLGLEVHEAPRLGRPRAAPASGASPGVLPAVETLMAGMVLTVEPGAYLPGWGGVRIEDDVAVTAEGAEVLTTVPRDLQVVG